MSGDGAQARMQRNGEAGAYDELVTRYLQIHRLEHARAIVFWDQAAKMPPKGNEARGDVCDICGGPVAFVDDEQEAWCAECYARYQDARNEAVWLRQWEASQ